MARAVRASFSVCDSECLASTRRTAGRSTRAAARRRVRLIEALPAPNSCSSSAFASWSTRRGVSPKSAAFVGCAAASSSCSAAARTVSLEASWEASVLPLATIAGPILTISFRFCSFASATF
eukprot:7385974-Prymnesium_polylepis.3